MEEKRRYIRIDAPIVVAYEIVNKVPAAKKSIIKDFSEGGIRFPVYEKLEVGAELELSIEIPFDTIPIFAQGQIMWIKALNREEGREIYDIGVQFREMQTFDKKRLVEATKYFLSLGKKYRAA